VSRPEGAVRLRPPSLPPIIRIFGLPRDLEAGLVLDHPRRHFVHLAGLEIAELKGPEGGTDEPVDL